MRSFVLQLPGPASYCECTQLCSRLTVEHVLPKSLLKRKLPATKFHQANQDPHNLFSCCQKLNQAKSNLLLGVNYDIGEHNGRLARACLHMNDFYKLALDEKILLRWRNFSLLYPPDIQEHLRNALINDKMGINNEYID